MTPAFALTSRIAKKSAVYEKSIRCFYPSVKSAHEVITPCLQWIFSTMLYMQNIVRRTSCAPVQRAARGVSACF